jgi:hypothetical protein
MKSGLSIAQKTIYHRLGSNCGTNDTNSWHLHYESTLPIDFDSLGILTRPKEWVLRLSCILCHCSRSIKEPSKGEGASILTSTRGELSCKMWTLNNVALKTKVSIL